MATTLNMGLITWENLSDPYDHTQLAGNFNAVDIHDHTDGKGVQIPTDGIEDQAITTDKIADGVVTTDKLADSAITVGKIANGVTSSLGDIKFWWRPNGLTSVPSGGWVIAGGQSIAAADHDFPGGGTIIVPNLIDQFPYGAILDDVGLQGGSNTINLQHSHNVNGHTHTVSPHTHTMDFSSGFAASTNLQISQDPDGAAWVHTDNHTGAQHRHTVYGSTDETGLTTNSATTTTDGRLGSSIDIRPAWIGLLPLIKVKNS